MESVDLSTSIVLVLVCLFLLFVCFFCELATKPRLNWGEEIEIEELLL